MQYGIFFIFFGIFINSFLFVRHSPYSPTHDRHPNSHRESSRHYDYDYDYEYDDRHSRPSERDSRSRSYRDHNLRSSDPYSNGRSYHTEEYSRLRRTEPPDHYESHRDRARPPSSSSPYTRVPHSSSYNSRYPPHYSGNSSVQQHREPSSYLRHSHEHAPSHPHPHPHSQVPEPREKYPSQLHNTAQPTAQTHVVQPRVEDIEPEHVKSFRLCMNQVRRVCVCSDYFSNGHFRSCKFEDNI